MRRPAPLKTWLTTCLLATLLFGTAARSEAVLPKPFTATYEVTYRGMRAGQLTFKLSRDAATGHYTYETTAAPSMLARFVVSSAAVERSVMEIGPEGVRPVEWHLDDGKSGTAKDGKLHFDWAKNVATGEIEGEQISLPLEAGLQDRLSIQIDVVTSLLRGEEPGLIPLIDDNRIKRYSYTKKEAAVIETKLGKLDTVLYESTREGSNRQSRFWLVPKMEYLAARAEQVRKGKVETVMTLLSVQ
ncbi:DUF3108 domain-containing protein [Steroidobacter sp.]|uniref:DUF3108 domain-containing protein n=1 Tax=Steroidobacter sp. TaxID=1978227 RepID=UPI001A600FD3|nr:DUF3108 domain-containing protein [Steroidobacter sp.]MBL8270809.1 DUF3108 domain-containing protein [Steroidobacter sp.]